MNGPAGELIAEPLPDIDAWQQELGVPIHLRGAWDWRTLSLDSTVSLPWEHKRRQIFPGLSARSRPAMWIVAVALGIHAVALAADWALLANEQKTLRQQMESQFRTVFPAAIAVVDPVLQMRRKLIEARRAAGLADNSDFLPMIENIATELRELAPGSLRTITYDDGKLALELAIDNVVAQRIAAGLRKYGLSVETLQAPTGMESGVAIQARAL
jgi:general secretion pathway protein L